MLFFYKLLLLFAGGRRRRRVSSIYAENKRLSTRCGLIGSLTNDDHVEEVILIISHFRCKIIYPPTAAPSAISFFLFDLFFVVRT